MDVDLTNSILGLAIAAFFVGLAVIAMVFAFRERTKVMADLLKKVSHFPEVCSGATREIRKLKDEISALHGLNPTAVKIAMEKAERLAADFERAAAEFGEEIKAAAQQAAPPTPPPQNQPPATPTTPVTPVVPAGQQKPN